MTDEEVQLGILKEYDANMKCVAFFREIVNMFTSDKQYKDFNETDIDAKELLEKLKEGVKTKLSTRKLNIHDMDAVRSSFNSFLNCLS